MDRSTIPALANSILHPTRFNVILRDLLRKNHKQYSNEKHLSGAIEWLCNSQDVSSTGGSSGSYRFDSGWAPIYPETTGYIISTFLKYADYSGDNSYANRAIRMGDWEIEIQMADGAVRGGAGINDYPIVFNTGMVILGWADLYAYTDDKRFLSSAVKAADWLCENMDDDGKWSKYTYKKMPHAYHSRVTWSLLEVYKHSKDAKYKKAAEKNIDWILSLVQENGWIDQMYMFRGEKPITHSIAYTLRGLLECSHFLDSELKQKIQNIVLLASEELLIVYEKVLRSNSSKPKLLPARYNNDWKTNSKFSCLTGNAQLAIIWLKIYQLNNNSRYLDFAAEMINQLKKLHNLESKNPGIRGGIAGSYPIWGSYMHYAYPNWSAKFFADALMLHDKIKADQNLS